MKWFEFGTASLLLLQGVYCDAFQQIGLSTISTPMLIAHSSHMGKLQITNRHQLKKAQFNIRGGGGGGSAPSSKSSLNMVDLNLLGVTFNSSPIQMSSLIFTATNLLGFLISIFTGSHLHLDLLGTGAFTAAALPTLLSSSSSTRVLVSSGAVALWGAKLASFLCFRAFKLKTDARLEETLSTVSGAGGFWFVSLLWGLLCSLPHTLGTTSSSQGSPITLSVGLVLYLLGLATETKADYQKWIFKQNNPGKFCNDGLWSISQHPNFFGNLLLWSGIFVMNVDSLIEPVKENGGLLAILQGSWKAWLALLSPAFMWTLFSGQAKGTITNSLELANKKYGSDSAYIVYIKNVPLIFPRIVDWLKKLFS